MAWFFRSVRCDGHQLEAERQSEVRVNVAGFSIACINDNSVNTRITMSFITQKQYQFMVTNTATL